MSSEQGAGQQRDGSRLHAINYSLTKGQLRVKVSLTGKSKCGLMIPTNLLIAIIEMLGGAGNNIDVLAMRRIKSSLLFLRCM